MANQETNDIVKGIAAKVMKMDEGDLTMDKRWKEDLGAKSAHVMKILALTKIRGGVDIKPEDLAACETLDDLADFIEAHQ